MKYSKLPQDEMRGHSRHHPHHHHHCYITPTGLNTAEVLTCANRPVSGWRRKILLILVIIQVIAFLLIYSYWGSSGFLSSFFSNYKNRNFWSSRGSTDRLHRQRFGFRKVSGAGVFHLPEWEEENLRLFYRPPNDLDPNYPQICYINGTDWVRTYESSEGCVCRRDLFFGPDCGIPAIVWSSHLFKTIQSQNAIRRLAKPRRVVIATIFFACIPTNDSLTDTGCRSQVSADIDFFRQMLSSLYDVLDLVLVTEFIPSNLNCSTNAPLDINEPKKGKMEINIPIGLSGRRTLKSELKSGCLKNYSDLIYHKSITVSQQWMKNVDLDVTALKTLWNSLVFKVGDFRPNDLILFMAPNTFPLKEVVTFLKFYEGFSEPVKLYSHWNKMHAYSHLLTIKGKNQVAKVDNHSFISETSRRAACDPIVSLDDVSSYIEYNGANVFNLGVTFEYLSILCRFSFNSFLFSQCVDNPALVSSFADTFWPIHLWTIGSVNRSSTRIFPCRSCLLNTYQLQNKSLACI